MPTALTENNGAPRGSGVVPPRATTPSRLVSGADVLPAAPNGQPAVPDAPIPNGNTEGHPTGPPSAAPEPERPAGPAQSMITRAAVIDPRLLSPGAVVPGLQSPSPQANLLVTVHALQGQYA